MSQAPSAAILLVGDELIAEHTRDALGGPLAAELQSLGCRVESKAFLPDDEDSIARAVAQALMEHTQFVFVIGGLGPTHDDRTRLGVAQGVKRELVDSPEAMEQIEKRYRERGKDVPDGISVQARFPEGAELVANPVGSAPGFQLAFGESFLFALPGVPREFRAMWERNVRPVLRDRLAGAHQAVSVQIRTAGLGESQVERRIAPQLETIQEEGQPVSVSFLANPGEVDVILRARAEELETATEWVETAAREVRLQLGDFVYGTGDRSLPTVVHDLLDEREATLGVAESCTGGLLGARITDLVGASRFFVGGVISYGNEQKQRLLAVDSHTLDSCGAVSAQVARAMAEGCVNNVGSTYGISITGIAGPDGGSADKPVGLVYIGLAGAGHARVARHTFTGDREFIRHRSASAALDELRRFLTDLPTLGHPESFDSEGT